MNIEKVIGLTTFGFCNLAVMALLIKLLSNRLRDTLVTEDGALTVPASIYYSSLFLSFTLLLIQGFADFSSYLDFLQKTNHEHFLSSSIKTGSVYIVIGVITFFIARSFTELCLIYLLGRRKLNIELQNDQWGYIAVYGIFLVCSCLIMSYPMESILIGMYPTIPGPYIIN